MTVPYKKKSKKTQCNFTSEVWEGYMYADLAPIFVEIEKLLKDPRLKHH